MRLRVSGSRPPYLLSVAALCVVAVLSGILFSTRTAEERSPSTEVEVAAVDEGDRLVAHARIVNNEGKDVCYTYHVLMVLPSGREEDHSGTILARDGFSFALAVNLYPGIEESADVRVRIYRGSAAEPIEDITFHFPLTALPSNSKPGE